MNQKTSVYLDGVRFTAAMVVFLGHASNPPISGGLFWQLYPYLQTAVMIFFVLSGYVIGYVVDNRESTPQSYFSSRIARIYSVVLPALIITAICDYIGIRFDEVYYTTYKPIVDTNEVPNYLLSLLLLQNIWELNWNPGTNGPFWSLSYEVVYYAIFGILFFKKGRSRWVMASLVAILSGPSIISLFPVWLFGLAVYYVHKHQKQNIFMPVAASLSLVSLGSLIYFSPWVRENYLITAPLLRQELLADYYDAALFSLHLLWLPQLLYYVKFNEHISNAIKWLASLTFVIYLFHYPIIKLISSIGIGEPQSMMRWIFVYIVTFFILVFITPYTDRLKNTIKRYLKNGNLFVRVFK